MTIEEAKQIKLPDYLNSLGFSPVKQQGDNSICCIELRNRLRISVRFLSLFVSGPLPSRVSRVWRSDRWHLLHYWIT